MNRASPCERDRSRRGVATPLVRSLAPLIRAYVLTDAFQFRLRFKTQLEPRSLRSPRNHDRVGKQGARARTRIPLPDHNALIIAGRRK